MLRVKKCQNVSATPYKRIDYDSPMQLKESLHKLNIKVEDTAEETLQQYLEHEVIGNILDYREVTKALSSFNYLPYIHPVTRRIHPGYFQTGTDTGRFSCKKPNLQQVPRDFKFRSLFVPMNGNKFVVADYSQIELRVAAEISGDKTMIDAYVSGQDLHRLTAALVTGKSLEEVSKQERQMAKAINFGLTFGMGAKGLVNYAKNSYGVTMTVKQANDFKNKFFKKYTGLKQWHNETYKLNAYVVRTLSGRRRLWNLNWDYKLTDRLNTVVQGTAADINKLALILLHKRLKGTEVKIIGTVHDEIILEAPAEKAEEVKKILEDAMVEAGQYYIKSVPVEVEGNICNSWAEK